MKTTKVYSAPGYPVDPKRHEQRMLTRVVEVLESAIMERPQQVLNAFFWNGENRVESPFMQLFQRAKSLK